MKKFVVLSALFLTIGCGDDGDDNNDNNSGDRAAAILALSADSISGGIVYSQECAVCHGADGTGTAQGNDLTVSNYTKAMIVNAVLNGIPGTTMIAYENLSDQQIADVSAYTLDLRN